MTRTARPTIDQAVAVFRDDVVPEYAAAADRLVANGEAAWCEDPQVDGTFALVLAGTRRALVLVYAPVPGVLGRERWDWETGDDLDALVHGQEAGL